MDQAHRSGAFTNRLASESSPYLLQHAHNPVDWYPWGPEAFAAARAQDKPIFLSVGYSTCYWCHVMERQCFEVPAIAEVMNRLFINIKVDREERPDVDQLYMAAVQVLTRQGGWPMSVFLTPQLEPFYGGTYFPPSDAHGRPGFPRLMEAIDDAYRQRREEVQRSADQLRNVLEKMAQPPAPTAPIKLDHDFLARLLKRSMSDYDSVDGGFGGAPKFPRQTLLRFALQHHRRFPSEKTLLPILHTLDAMAAGGIRDQLGGGFHRYSTDDRWLVPHFEIMLYDNAMLAWIYADVFAQTRNEKYAGISRGILDFLLREMTGPDGEFYTAFDAEVDGQEGLNYLWTDEQIDAVLGADAALFNDVYGVAQGPNFADPHHGTGEPDQNILFLPEPLADVAKRRKMTEAQLSGILTPLRQKLRVVRQTRKQPLLDTKILTSWNALAIEAFAYAGQVFGEARYTSAASRSADFLLTRHRNPNGRLIRTTRNGRGQTEAFLDDYAFFVRALLALGGDRAPAAQAVYEQMISHFYDAEHGGFFFTRAGADDLIVRQKSGTDSPLPSGNAVAAAVSLQLASAETARKAIAAFSAQMQQFGDGMSATAEALLLYLEHNAPFTLQAHDQPTQQTNEIPDPVSIVTKWADAQELHVRLIIADGYHINAHDAGGGLIPLNISISGAAEAQVDQIDYPEAFDGAFEFSDQTVRMHIGTVVAKIRFATTVTDNQSEILVAYQPCNDRACLAPQRRSLRLAPMA